MAHNNKEIEIQARVENAAPLQAFLEAEATWLGEERQRDEYFTPGHKDYLSVRPVNEWLRLREADTGVSINYKDWSPVTHCDEYETSLGDLEKGRLVLHAMGCRQIGVVEKVRKLWRWKDWDISIDRVTDLGEFVELEYSGEEDVEPQEVIDAMIAFLKERDCGKVELNSTGYPFLILFPEEQDFREV